MKSTFLTRKTDINLLKLQTKVDFFYFRPRVNLVKYFAVNLLKSTSLVDFGSFKMDLQSRSWGKIDNWCLWKTKFLSISLYYSWKVLTFQHRLNCYSFSIPEVYEFNYWYKFTTGISKSIFFPQKCQVLEVVSSSFLCSFLNYKL